MKYSETYPFTVYKHKNGVQIERTELPLRITNPYDGTTVITYALVDTGADACLFPRKLSDHLNHQFDADGVKSSVTGGVGGASETYKHTFRVELLNHNRDKVVWSPGDLLIDCVDRDLPLLLGVQDFLKDFELIINYPKKIIVLNWN